MWYVKYLKVLLYIFIPLLILNALISIFYYFGIIPSNIINYFKLVISCISMLIGGVYIGIKSNKKGWLEGIKVGFIVIILYFIISYLVFDSGISIKTLLYYLILLISSMLGSIIGINLKKAQV
ncbi:MAG: TIGR04086 family membrane protein [Firmicutes bacterium]|nr:TIGR04086 family membrane protein [Bacillota bacterium]